MKNLLLFLIMLAIFVISSCCKPTFDYRTVLKNTTDQEIKLLYFKNDQSISTVINAKSETIANGPFYEPGEKKDSLLVYRNGILKEIHYPQSNKKTVSNAEVFPFENPRNLLNSNNYSSSRKELPCNGYNATYIYTF